MRSLVQYFVPLFAIALAFAPLAGGAQDGGQLAFEVEQLNPQLGPVPDDVERDTPWATVRGLLERVAAGESGAHFLNFTDIEDVNGDTAAALRAAELAEVINRAISVDWSRLTDRQDGLLDTAPAEALQAGQARRSVLLGQVEMRGYHVPIRLNRLETPDGTRVWVFSQTTVAAIPQMHAAYGPSELERMLPAPLRAEAWFGLMWWELLALPLALALTLLAAFMAWRIVGWAARGERMAARMARAARGPFALMAATAMAFWLTTAFFAFSSEISHIANPLVALGLALAVLLLVLRAFDVILEDLVSFDTETLQNPTQDRGRAIATRVSALRRALLVLIVGVAGVVALHELQLAGGLGMSFLASAGLLTLLLGFAARTVLGNILASMQIALNQSARIGDKVMFRDALCHVERIHFTFVQLRVWTGVRMIVPVSEFVSEPFENWTLQERPMIRLIELRLAHRADIDGLRDDFEEIMDELDPEQLGDRDAAFVLVSDQDMFSIEVMFGLPCANPNTAWTLSCDVRERIVAAAVRRSEDGERIFPDVRASEAA